MPMDYAGQLASAVMEGEVKLLVEEDGLTLSSLFDSYHIPYAELTAIEAPDYHILIRTEKDSFLISRLGMIREAFYEELYAAYNRKVRKALFVGGKPLLETRGEFHYRENERSVRGTALLEVYENCILILPPDDNGRRVPLCFVSRMNKGNYELSLELDTGESYTFLRLGYDTDPYADCITKCLHTLRENSIQAVKGIDGTLTPSQLQAIGRLMPEGVAVQFSRLYEIAPSFVKAVEDRINESRIIEEYKVFKELSDPMKICIGMKSHLAGEDAENILWLICPGAKPGVAAVELAISEEAAAATFLYRGFDQWEIFCRRLNQAMEAINFKREVIRLTEEELHRSEYGDYIMAVKRNPSLQFIRRYFGGRVIHSSAERWKQELLNHMQ